MCQIRVNLRRWACLLAALACLLALLPLPAHAAGAASKVVRVGWYEDAYNITGKNGERSGYAYEYEQSVAAYTGWTYEYVKAGWSDLLQMMKNGEIDLMAGVSYTEDRAQDMLFSELPMGREIYYLYADLAHTDISASDLRTLNGKRIALLKTSVQAAQFYQWEEDHGLHLQYVWSNSFEQGKQQAQGREIDCVISTETPAWVEYGMSAIAQTGGSDIYFAISRTRQDLKEELDHAMRKMEFDKPFYADELYQRYLSASYTPVLSSEEQDWVTQHGDIRIGFLTSDAGISTYVPESGQLVGVINDYITFASDSISNQKLDFSLVGYDSMEEEVQALKDGQIDLIFHFAQNPYVAEENNFVLSNTVLTLNMAAVTAQTWQAVRRDLRREMRIDVPGTGIAFTVPLSSIGGKQALMFLTEHQPLIWKEESTLKDTRYELLLAIANQGYTGSIMDAARAAGAGGGTVIHAKGTGMEGASRFLGMELVNEKELVLIVVRTPEKNRIMKAIMDGAGPKAGAIVFSLPVTDTAGLRLLEEEEPAAETSAQ